MSGLPDWAVYGVPALTIIVAVINYLKEIGLETKYVFPVSVLLGSLFGVGYFLSNSNEVASLVFNIVMGAVLLGLAASGYYSWTKHYLENGKKEG